ncbi:nucleolar GTP-binding protein [Enteropsectra breve]|nr:nucleolar GTP-binding protein [Enteropsectra breve]
MYQNFSFINQVPQCTDLIDIALSKTNRKTPTIVRAKFEIHRIRNFYTRKVKFSAGEFSNRLDTIQREFPVLEDIHPFYSDLINILYDKDHYKIALGQINAVKHKVDVIQKEYVRLLNFGDSLHRCKALKKAALGKMASTVKKLNDSLKYLEEVRQHLTRLPSIDPSTRTLVIAGFPNIGKSSFMNKVSRAHVDVQPYAFTTKNIFVGHFDYQNLRWQILDTPGILDQQLEDRNGIEMLTITALAHLKSAVLFFIDVSETCGFSIEDQISLYENLSPLLTSQLLIVFSKADLAQISQVENEMLKNFIVGKRYVEMSVQNDYNVELVRNTICDMLLQDRLAEKEDRISNFIHRIKPVVPRNEVNAIDDTNHLGTSPFIGLHECETYYCDNKYDIVPEIYNGKNVIDFIAPNIEERLHKAIENDANEHERKYDILSRDERQTYEDCNNARLQAIASAHFNARSTIPKSWKNTVTSSGELVADIKRVTPVVKVEKVSFNKKVCRQSAKKNLDMAPKRTYRRLSTKHGKISRTQS